MSMDMEVVLLVLLVVAKYLMQVALTSAVSSTLDIRTKHGITGR